METQTQIIPNYLLCLICISSIYKIQILSRQLSFFHWRFPTTRVSTKPKKMMLLICLVIATFLVSSLDAGVPNVFLEVYIESGCPVSQGFILGELTSVLAMPDIKAITDFKYVPYGNSERQPDGTFICYDDNECTTDALELCAMYKLSNNIKSINTGDTAYAAFPFNSCMELNKGWSIFGEPCWVQSMGSANVNVTYADILTCSKVEFNVVMSAAQLATPTANGPLTVPYVVVDGLHLSDPNTMLLSAICDAYKGVKPASCEKK